MTTHLAFRARWLLLLACGGLLSDLRAEPPALLARAFSQWVAGRDDLAFTQQTRFYYENGTLRGERIERFDPSLPDSRRWRLIEVNGKPATDRQRRTWETKKNRKPKKKVEKSPSEYVDLEHAVLVEDKPDSARYKIRLRPEEARLLGVQQVAAIVTVDKKSGSIVHIEADLHQPMRVLMGLARITDLDVDVHMEPLEDDSPKTDGSVETGSTAHVAISTLGFPMEYNWSDFKRVTPYDKPNKS